MSWWKPPRAWWTNSARKAKSAFRKTNDRKPKAECRKWHQPPFCIPLFYLWERAMHTFEYATLEWIWEAEGIRLNMPNGEESQTTGSYNEVVELLNFLGQQGWEVATCVASANWMFWTLKRPIL
jgi:hypothetical protein